MDILVLIITGSVGAAVIKLIESVLLHRLSNKAKKNTDFITTVKELRTAQRVILHDRIKYLCKGFLRAGKVDVDDLSDLIDMHKIYHDDLGGNGGLDHLMNEVKQLPKG